MLNEINEALRRVDDNVFYGGVTDIGQMRDWNYIVFQRADLKRTTRGNTAYTQELRVVIVREDYVPEETIREVIDALEALPNVRLKEDAASFEYDRKQNTKTVMEMAILTFCWVEKRDAG